MPHQRDDIRDADVSERLYGAFVEPARKAPTGRWLSTLRHLVDNLFRSSSNAVGIPPTIASTWTAGSPTCLPIRSCADVG